MPRIPAGRVTESGEVILTKPEKEVPGPKKKKQPVPHDWKTKAKQNQLRKKARDRR